MITTVVFDLDDTLYDEIKYCKSGFRAVADFIAKQSDTSSAGRIFDRLWSEFTSGNHNRTFNSALDKLGINYDDNFIAELVAVYRGHNPRITLPPDCRNALENLSSEYTLALLTDGFLPAQKLKVQALGIENYFKCIIYTEQIGRQFWKPSPLSFEKLLAELNVEPQNCVYVADNEKKDFIAPNKMGFLTVQLLRPARIHFDKSMEPDATAQHQIHKISQLQGLLEKF